MKLFFAQRLLVGHLVSGVAFWSSGSYSFRVSVLKKYRRWASSLYSGSGRPRVAEDARSGKFDARRGRVKPLRHRKVSLGAATAWSRFRAINRQG